VGWGSGEALGSCQVLIKKRYTWCILSDVDKRITRVNQRRHNAGLPDQGFDKLGIYYNQQSGWQRKRWVKLYCHETGKVAYVDQFESRLLKMRMAIIKWADDMLKFRDGYPGQTRMVMIMLTYRRVIDYKPGHINLYIKNLKRRLGSRLLTFAWVAELQKRKAVHYHLVVLVKAGTNIPAPDTSGMWKHGWSGRYTARSPHYLVKYTGKEYQKDLSLYPKSTRLYAVSPRAYFSLNLVSGDGTEMFPIKQKVEHYKSDQVWEYMGASVTRDYAVEVLPPS
jgi:hypothetical protein